MYRTTSIIPNADDPIVARMSGHIPVIEFDPYDVAGSVKIHVPGGNATDQAAWLTAFAEKLTALADEITVRGLTSRVSA